MNKLRFLMPIGLIAIAALSSLAVMLLWNWLMPAIFGLIAISFWQALGLLVLSRLLFGGFGFGKHRFMKKGKHHHDHFNPIRDKWMKMSEEERKEFIKKRMMHGFCSSFTGGHFGAEHNEETKK